MEILGEIQSSEGREEELQAVLQSEDRSSAPPSGPSENATSALDEPSSGIQTEETSSQSPIQQSENLEDLDNLISAASCRRKVIKDKICHELAILDIERQVAERRLLLLSKLNQQCSSPTAIAVQLSALPVAQQNDNHGLPEKKLAAVFNAKELLVLVDIVTASLADRFKDQSLRPGFNCDWSELILPEAVQRIQLRLQGQYSQVSMTYAESLTWHPRNQSLIETAQLIADLFARPNKTESTVEVTVQIKQFNWGFSYKNRVVEETTVTNFKRLLKNHYGQIEKISSKEQNGIAKLLYKKLQKNSELQNMFYVETQKALLVSSEDSVEACILRMSKCINDVRNLIEAAKRYGSIEDVWYSGSTISGANVKCSLDTVITDPQVKWGSQNRSIASLNVVQSQGSLSKLFYCDTCGKKGHTRNSCRSFRNPLANNTSAPWPSSPMGLAWKKIGYDQFTMGASIPGLGTAVPTFDLQPPGWVYPSSGRSLPVARASLLRSEKFSFPPSLNDQAKKQKCKTSSVQAALFKNSSDDLLPVRLFLNIQTTTKGKGSEKNNQEEQLLHQGPVPASTLPHQRRQDSITVLAAPETAVGRSVMCRALLDSGSLAGDFINGRMLSALNGVEYLRSDSAEFTVCSGLDNKCVSLNVFLDVVIEITIQRQKHYYPLSVRISQDSPIDVILGRETIKRFNFVTILPQFFFMSSEIPSTVSTSVLTKELLKAAKSSLSPTIPVEKQLRSPVQDKGSVGQQKEHSGNVAGKRKRLPLSFVSCKKPCSSAHSGCASCGDSATLPRMISSMSPLSDQVTLAPQHAVPRRVRFNDTPLECRQEIATPSTIVLAPAQTDRPVAALLQEPEQLVGVDDFGDEEIDYNAKDMFTPFRTPKGKDDPIVKITIEGSPLLQQQIRELCYAYKHIFSDKLDSRPARLTPFELNVDKAKWETFKNRCPVRPQSAVKQVEINKQVQEMLEAGIIEKSTATYYSQVLLTPKPNGEFRFCVDYRALNDATESASWPIPNIAHLLARLGKQRANIFGVMDLTAGYHQAPISLEARPLTSFITFSGVYQFTRLPFGPKRAPSYFQEMMSTIVLRTLMYNICEMYLDDCIVYATTGEEFCERLEKVFIRFQETHIFLKASKCKFGMSQVQYVGKTISREGIIVSQKQIQGVVDFPQPMVNTQLRSFLGFVNYFRDHVPNHSDTVAPLTKMIDYSAKKQSKLCWTQQGITAFKEIKRLISISPMLYFIDDHAPVFLMTDASDYGIGGYLYQELNGVKQLVALVSKALTVSQLRWSVIQKEAYGIYYCCNKLDTLLRDRKFTILTDHRNLLYITNASNPMVVRWWMALQELDFDIVHVQGVKNIIADTLSRLCENKKEAQVKFVAALHAQQPITTEHYDLIAFCHNTIVGHGGVERTLRKVKQLKYKWEYMRSDVKEFIRKCPCCQKMSQVKPAINALNYTTSTYSPMECLNIDFIGPFPDSGYLLVIICTFTRWVEIYPTPDASAKSACDSLLKHVGRFGAPSFIRSDNGPHFANKVIQEFLQAVGTRHNLTLAYCSQENAIVERCNKEINRHIRAFTFDRATTEGYQSIIPFVQRILNASVNETMQVSPAQLLFGNAINLDRGIFLPPDELPVPTQSLTRATSRMLHDQEALLNTASNLLRKSDESHTGNQPDDLTEFAPDSYVLAAPRSHPETRMHTHWSGPYKVVSHKDNEYTLLDLVTTRTKKYHVSQLKQFRYNPINTDPTDIARRDHLEFFVEKILEFNGDCSKVSSLQFKVKWMGYDETYNSWEPWSALRDTEQLHRYLIEVKLQHLIPRKFKDNYML